MRWAPYEAAQSASRRGSPDNAYYRRGAARIGRRATGSVARKLLRRAYHTLAELGEHALAPPA